MINLKITPVWCSDIKEVRNKLFDICFESLEYYELDLIMKQLKIVRDHDNEVIINIATLLKTQAFLKKYMNSVSMGITNPRLNIYGELLDDSHWENVKSVVPLIITSSTSSYFCEMNYGSGIYNDTSIRIESLYKSQYHDSVEVFLSEWFDKVNRINPLKNKNSLIVNLIILRISYLLTNNYLFFLYEREED